MKLWELIVELEKLEQQGKRDYDVKAVFYSDEADVTEVICLDKSKTIYL